MAVVDSGRARADVRIAACLLLLTSMPAQAGVCTEVALPPLGATERPGFLDGTASNRHISADGSAVLVLGRPEGTDSRSREIYVFNPITGALTAITSNTPRVEHVTPTGVVEVVTINVAGITADGRYVFQTYPSRAYFQLVNGVQVPALRTRGELSHVIDLATGTRTAIPSRVDGIAQSLGVPFGSTIIDISSDGRYVLMREVYGNGGSVPFQHYLYRLDRQTGTSIDIWTPSTSLVSSVAPTFVSDGSTYGMSGDGRYLALSGDLDNRLQDPSGMFVSPGNVAQMWREPYLLDMEGSSLQRVYAFDISQPTSGGSILGFVRSLGQTGLRHAFDRTGPIAGDPNPDSVARIGWVDDQQQISVLIPGRDWLRGRFGTALGSISEDESRIYFISGDDLTGENPQLSNQLYSVEIATGTVRQRTNLDDGGAALLALGYNFEAGNYQSVSFVAASHDHSTLMVQAYNVAGDGTSADAERQSDGRVVVNRSSADSDSGKFVRVYRCPD